MPEERLILASKSPRRREILGLLGLAFDVETEDVDEKAIEASVLAGRGAEEPFGDVCARLVMALAEAKAKAVYERLGASAEGAVILGADTVVVLGENVLGKPRDKAEAVSMLSRLAGRTHEVYTGAALWRDGEKETFYCRTSVTFYPLDDFTEQVIRRYADSGSPLDKAGGYGIQDMGALLVEKIDGDFHNVVGLPAAELARHLVSFSAGGLRGSMLQ